MSEHEFVAPILDPPGDGNLPGTPPPFVGRTEELARLTELIDQAPPKPVVITGATDARRSALVMHWADNNPSRFDGVPIVLRTTRLPMRRLLTRLGVAHAAIPEGLAAQLRQYREAVGSQRPLVVLDGIEEPATVGRLLGGVPGSTVLITSRAAVDWTATLRLAPVDQDLPLGIPPVSRSGMALLEWLRSSPGLDISLDTLVALMPDGRAEAELALRPLTLHGLLERQRSRFWLADRSHLRPPEPPLADGALQPRRIIDHYLNSALDADRLLSPMRPQWVPAIAADVTRDHIADAGAALDWFDDEHTNLLAIQLLCLRKGWFEQAWQLAWALETYHRRRGLLGDPATTWPAATDTARLLTDAAGISVVRQAVADLDDPVGEATPEVLALERIAAVNAELGDFQAARRNWDRVRDLRRGPVTEVTVYTSDNVGEPLRDAVVELLQVAGFAVVGKDTPVRGSWFQRLRVRGDAKAVDKLGELAGKLERAAELKYIATPRSENDEREANAIAKLAEAMKDVDEVVIRTSSVLFVKTAGCVMSIVLSEEQIRCLDRNPQLMQAPAKVLDALAELVRGEPVPLAVEGQTG
ncbi:hypothetical protein [Crossiella sp. CA198]|uniref:hypothetical protein n=1 Tax=Crossiella sp. CA198 TaxID=3455607 RepID=UPI003F8D8069